MLTPDSTSQARGGRAMDTLEGYRLSPQQQRLWSLGSGADADYSAQLLVRLDGEVDLERLVAALGDCVRRHDVLRTGFARLRDGELPLQVVSESAAPSWRRLDLSALRRSEQRAVVRAIERAEARAVDARPGGSALRACLLLCAADTVLLLVSLPALCADSRSLELLFEELVAGYSARCRLEPHERPMPYAQYSEWQQQLLELDETAEEREFWRARDYEPLMSLTLPFERPRRPDVTSPVIEVGSALPGHLESGLAGLGRRLGMGLEELVLAVWLVQLARYAGGGSVGVAHRLPGRPYEELERSLGLFEKYLPVQVRVPEKQTFRAFVEDLRAEIDEIESWLEYFDWRQVLPRGGGRSLPLGFETTRRPKPLRAGEVGFEVLRQRSLTERCRLVLRLCAEPGGHRLAVRFDSRLFFAADLERMLGGLRAGLAAVLVDPTVPAEELSLLPAAERRQVVSEFQPRARYFPGETLLHRRVEDCALRHPERPAVCLGDRCWTYGRVRREANRLARVLRRWGAGPETLVGIFVERSLELPSVLLGVLKTGAAFVPLDPEYPRERLRAMVEDSGLSWVVCGPGLAGDAPIGRARVLDLEAHRPLLAAEPAGDPPPPAVEPDLVYAIYTSGSTGRPKAALNRHRGVVNRLLWMQSRLGFGSHEAVLHKTPLSFDVAMWEIFLPLISGARIVLAEPGGQRRPGHLIERIEEAGASTVHFVPAMLRAFLQHPEVERCRGLSRLISSGEALPPDLVQLARERLPTTELYNLYGPTEAAIDVSWARAAPTDDPEAASSPPVPIGRPIDNLQLYVADGALEPTPMGVAGELLIGGVGVGRGYLGRPALTALRFVPDPFGGAPGGRLYRSGDAARWLSSGELDFIGRLDQQVKIRGFRIEPGEVESVLLEHPRLTGAVVVVREDIPDYPRLVAYVAARREPGGAWPEAPTEAIADSVRSFLEHRLPAHLMPSAIVAVDELPLLPSGKVDRAALPAPPAATGRGGTQGEHPIERTLIEIWRRVLGVEGIGLDDDFLALGGDSILGMQVASAASAEGLALRPAQVFEHGTVRRLARAVERDSGPELRDQRSVVGPVRLTPVQHWFFELGLPRPEHWNQAVLLETARPLDPAALGRALAALVEHHDALRLRFETEGASWKQRVAEPQGETALAVVDLGGLRLEDARAVREALGAGFQRSLDLERGPLFRAGFFPGPDATQHRLLLVAHHLVVDGVSWRILLADLERAYSLAETGAPVELPPKTVSYQAWAEALYRRAQSQDVVQQLDYWLALPWADGCRLPIDEPGGLAANVVATEEVLTRTLDAARTADLLERTSQAYRTEVTDLLIAAVVRAVSRWTGGASVPLVLETHGREAADLALHRTVGWFTALVPLVINFGQASTPGAALVSVKEQLRQLPDHGLGHGLLRYLNAQGDSVSRLRALPRPELVFNYLGRFDALLSDSGLFRPASGSEGPLRAPEGPRPHLLEVNAWVFDGRLEIAWSFSSAVHRRRTIEALAEHCMEALEALIEHCLSPEASGCTLSDFPLAELTSEELERLVAQVGDGTMIEAVYPLSPSQEGMLMYLQLQREEEGSEVFFNQLHCELRGDLDLHAFQRCWQQITDRHPALRTLFSWRELRRPLQVVRERVEPGWALEDWRGITPGALAHRFERYLEEDRARGFDLERPPLVRFALFRIDDGVYRFVLSYHHLVLDGWSLALMFREALEAYRESLGGRRLMLRPAPSFADYVAWVKQQDELRAEEFWRRRLAGFRQPTPLPGDRRRARAAMLHDRVSCRLSSAESARLGAVARQQMLTQNTLLQGAWALLLHEQTGADEVIFGNVVSGREAGFERTLGLFINALPARTRLPWDRSMTSWLQQFQREQIEARSYQFCALEQIQRWSEVPWGEPLFETLVVFENYPVEGELLEGRHGIEVTEIHAEERSNYPLSLFVFPGEQIELELGFDSGRIDRPTAEQLLARLELLLQRMLAAPHTTPAGPLALTAGERAQVVEEWNDTAHSWPAGSVLQMMTARAAEQPRAPAVIGRQATLTYGELDRRSGQLATELRRRGLAAGGTAAIWLERSPDLLLAIFAVLKCDAAYLPLDPLTPPARAARRLRVAGAGLLISRSAVLGSSFAEGSEPALPTLDLDAEWQRVAAHPALPPPAAPHPRSAVYAIATSGTTGEPRVVVVPHAALANHARWAVREMALEAGDRVLQFASPAFDASAEEIFPTLAAGAALVLRDDDMLASPGSFLRGLEQLEVTVADLPTSFWHRLVRDSSGAVVLPRSLRLMVVGGERLDPHLLEQWRLRFGPVIRLLNSYGPTEATVVATCAELTSLGQGLPPESAALPAPSEVSIGRPLPNVRAYVLDRRGRPVPPGVPGELTLAGAGLAEGYRGAARLTAERFVPDPFGEHPGERLYRTGDAACWRPDGELVYRGRLDAQLKVDGYRVEPAEIEARLEALAEVRRAVVVAIDGGPQQGRLAAYLELAPGAALPTPEDLRAELRRELPEYMVPAVFTALAALPRGASGKIDRRALPEPEVGSLAPARTYVTPRNEAERQLADIFAQLLGAPRVGAFDGFFDLGGHSLLATRLVAEVRRTFGVDLPLRQIFETPSVARLAAVIVSLILDRLEELPDDRGARS